MTYRRVTSPPLNHRSHSELALCHDPVPISGPISPDSTACSSRNFKHRHHRTPADPAAGCSSG